MRAGEGESNRLRKRTEGAKVIGRVRAPRAGALDPRMTAGFRTGHTSHKPPPTARQLILAYNV